MELHALAGGVRDGRDAHDAAGRSSRRPSPGPVAAARLSTAALPPFDPLTAPWPLRTLLIDGRGVAVRETPTETERAEPAVYVHGLGGSATNWTDLAGLLSGHLAGTAVDLPGFGASDPPAGGDYRLRAHADVLANVIRRLGTGPVHLLGNSLGGIVSALVAAEQPELVRTLTLVSPAMPDLRPRRGPAPLLSAFAVPGVRNLAHRYVGRYSTEARVRAVLEACFADPTLVPPPRLVETIAEAQQREVLPWASEAFAGSVRSLIAAYFAPGRHSLWATVRAIEAPTLVLWGDQDRLVDVDLAPRTARAIPDARLLVLPGVGHTAHIESPEVVARAVLGLLGEARRARVA